MMMGWVGLTPSQHEFLRRELARFSYKPGWTFDFDLDHMIVSIQFVAPDAYGSDKKAAVTSRQMIPIHLVDMNIKQIAHWLLAIIRDMELHETLEWFRVDGVQFDNPHKRG